MFGRRNIDITYRQIIERIKGFLEKNSTREFFVFLFFFIVAGAFWLLQTLNNTFETEFNIPVRMKKVPDNVIITSAPPTSIQVKVRDKGTTLLNYQLGKGFYPLTLEFTESKNSQNQITLGPNEIAKEIRSQLNASTELLGTAPDTLEYIYSKGISKRIPVKLNANVYPAQRCYLADTIFSPDSVVAYAPPSTLDEITAAFTQYFEVAEVGDTLRRTIALQSPKGVKFIPDKVRLTLPVDIYTEKTIKVPLTPVGFSNNRVLRLFPSTVSVTFQIGMTHFREIDAEDFYIPISYEELKNFGSDSFPINVETIKCPSTVSNIRISPAKVDFLIEQIYTSNVN